MRQCKTRQYNAFIVILVYLKSVVDNNAELDGTVMVILLHKHVQTQFSEHFYFLFHEYASRRV